MEAERTNLVQKKIRQKPALFCYLPKLILYLRANLTFLAIVSSPTGYIPCLICGKQANTLFGPCTISLMLVVPSRPAATRI